MPSERPAVPSALCRRLRVALPRWFARHRRDLPWRRDRDPYRIWVSEVMLQQTTVAAVVPYFERFVHAFPDLASLAASDEHDVLRLWEGLGYYRRARDLYRAARMIAADGGCVPDDPAAFAALPGVGRYMTGAVLSQAFERRLPILEANSQRVLCRLLGERDDPRKGPVRKRLWDAAESLLPPRGVGDFNQALMELGALVCTPTTPDCSACPLAPVCAARRLGLQAKIPPRPRRPDVVQVREAAVVVRRGSRVLLVQRPPTGRWANMWEFPHDELQRRETYEDAASGIARRLLGMRVAVGSELVTIKHSVTQHRITLVCFEARHLSGVFRPGFYRRAVWLPVGRLHAYAVSVPQRKLAQALAAERQRVLF